MENEAVYRITKTKNLGKLEFPSIITLSEEEIHYFDILFIDR